MSFFGGFFFVFSHPLNRKQFWRTLGRVIWWKINQRFFSLPTVVPLTAKIQCLCWPHLSYSGLIVYTRWPDFAEWSFLQKYLKNNHIFVDVGAHTGDYSLLAADKITTGSIYAFEPDPRVLPYLHQNVVLNGLEKVVTIFPHAVSNKKGRISFTLDIHSETSHLTKKNETGRERRTIAATTLDIFAREKLLSRIDVLKIDVEGAEGRVFAGADDLLRQQKIGLILFELNPESQRYGTSPQEVVTQLSECGYRTYYFSDPEHLQLLEAPLDLVESRNFVGISEQLFSNPVVRSYITSKGLTLQA